MPSETTLPASLFTTALPPAHVCTLRIFHVAYSCCSMASVACADLAPCQTLGPIAPPPASPPVLALPAAPPVLPIPVPPLPVTPLPPVPVLPPPAPTGLTPSPAPRESAASPEHPTRTAPAARVITRRVSKRTSNLFRSSRRRRELRRRRVLQSNTLSADDESIRRE